MYSFRWRFKKFRHRVFRAVPIILLKFPCILYVRYLQYQFKRLQIKHKCNRTNQLIARIKLIQSILEFLKSCYAPWGIFHPRCSYGEKHEKFMNWLFPELDFDPWDIIIWHKKKAVTYYHNKIFKLQNNKSSQYSREIKHQLMAWNSWRY